MTQYSDTSIELACTFLESESEQPTPKATLIQIAEHYQEMARDEQLSPDARNIADLNFRIMGAMLKIVMDVSQNNAFLPLTLSGNLNQTIEYDASYIVHYALHAYAAVLEQYKAHVLEYVHDERTAFRFETAANFQQDANDVMELQSALDAIVASSPVLQLYQKEMNRFSMAKSRHAMDN